MKIEQGKFYRRRDGVVVGPIVRLHDTFWSWTVHTIASHPVWTLNGVKHPSGRDKGDWDLIEEVFVTKVNSDGTA